MMTEDKQDIKEVAKILLKLNSNNLMLVSSGAELLLASQEMEKKQKQFNLPELAAR